MARTSEMAQQLPAELSIYAVRELREHWLLGLDAAGIEASVRAWPACSGL